MSQRKALHELPLRTASGPHRCNVCLGNIRYGEHYHDGGYPRRAHPGCAVRVQEGIAHELSIDELQQIEDAELAVSRVKGELFKVEQWAADLRGRLTAPRRRLS